MRVALLILSLPVIAYSQTRQCGAPASFAANPEPASTRTGVAAKPDNSRRNIPILPQVRTLRTPPAPLPSCWCGTVDASMLTSPSLSQEVTMLAGLSGKFRFDHLLVQESKQFSSGLVNRLVVSVGMPGNAADLISTFGLKSDLAPENFAFVLPNPPVLSGTYDLVLKFAGSAPLAIDGSANFSAGSLYWEVCGGQAR